MHRQRDLPPEYFVVLLGRGGGGRECVGGGGYFSTHSSQNKSKVLTIAHTNLSLLFFKV